MAYKDPYDPRSREARMRWYRKNKEKQIDRQSERKREMREWVRTLKTNCNRCPYDNPVALVFHHSDPSQKDISIAEAIGKGWGKQRILKEIEKCEVICANCHHVEHF